MFFDKQKAPVTHTTVVLQNLHYSTIDFNSFDRVYFEAIFSKKIIREVRIPNLHSDNTVKDYFFIELTLCNDNASKNNGKVVLMVVQNNKSYRFPVSNAKEICNSFKEVPDASINNHLAHLYIDSVPYMEIVDAMGDTTKQKQALEKMDAYQTQQKELHTKIFGSEGPRF